MRSVLFSVLGGTDARRRAARGKGFRMHPERVLQDGSMLRLDRTPVPCRSLLEELITRSPRPRTRSWPVAFLG